MDHTQSLRKAVQQSHQHKRNGASRPVHCHLFALRELLQDTSRQFNVSMLGVVHTACPVCVCVCVNVCLCVCNFFFPLRQ